jgi:two-component system, NarL family, invasion response regulator UvrY
MTNTVLKILIADDHAIVRKGLVEILRDGAADAVVEEARNGLEALEKARAHNWDVIILDITMPGMNGLDVLRELKRERPQPPVIMLSMHSGANYVNGSLKIGAAGYLNKESAPEELIEAIRTVTAGGTYLSRGLEAVVH